MPLVKRTIIKRRRIYCLARNRYRMRPFTLNTLVVDSRHSNGQIGPEQTFAAAAPMSGWALSRHSLQSAFNRLTNWLVVKEAHQLPLADDQIPALQLSHCGHSPSCSIFNFGDIRSRTMTKPLSRYWCLWLVMDANVRAVDFVS